jgi:hypothetical protein
MAKTSIETKSGRQSGRAQKSLDCNKLIAADLKDHGTGRMV